MVAPSPEEAHPIRDGIIRTVGGGIVAAIVWFLVGKLPEPPKTILIIALGAVAIVIVIDMVGVGTDWPVRHVSPSRIALTAGCLFFAATFLAFRDASASYGVAAALIILLELTLLTFMRRDSGATLSKVSNDVGSIREYFGSVETLLRDLGSGRAHQESFESVLREVGTLRSQLQEVESLIRHEHTAITATCFPFTRTSHGVDLYLIQNPNFERWWLAPGAHCDLGGDGFGFPEDIAANRCYEEAGLEVRILEALPRITDDYDDCHPHCAPHFTYALDILQTAKCSKRQHHKQHYDLVYVAEVTKVREDPPYQRLVVPLQLDADSDRISAAIKDAVRRWRTEHSMRAGGAGDSFPPDFPSRAAAALELFTGRIQNGSAA